MVVVVRGKTNGAGPFKETTRGGILTQARRLPTIIGPSGAAITTGGGEKKK